MNSTLKKATTREREKNLYLTIDFNEISKKNSVVHLY